MAESPFLSLVADILLAQSYWFSASSSPPDWTSRPVRFLSRSYWNCRWTGPWDSARMVPSALYSYAASLCPSSCYAPILAKGRPNRKLEWMRRLCHGDTGGAFGLISYKRLHQTGRASGTLLPLLNEVADGEARAGFPSVLHIQDTLAALSSAVGCIHQTKRRIIIRYRPSASSMMKSVLEQAEGSTMSV